MEFCWTIHNRRVILRTDFGNMARADIFTFKQYYFNSQLRLFWSSHTQLVDIHFSFQDHYYRHCSWYQTGINNQMLEKRHQVTPENSIWNF